VRKIRTINAFAWRQRLTLDGRFYDLRLRWSERLVETLMQGFRKEDQTVWGVWNAMTEWSSHGQRKANASALGTLIGREQRVAQAMRDPRWDEMLAI